MRYLLLIAMLFLAGCQDTTQVVTTYKYMVVHPDEAMYQCPVLTKFPDWKTLTDAQVAKTVLILHKNNVTCKSSIESIRNFLREADKKMGSR
jgi:hypothetical protein